MMNFKALCSWVLTNSRIEIFIFKFVHTKIVRVLALSQSGEISPDFCCFYGGGIRHNEDIMHSFQNFIVRLIPNHPPPLETRIWKLVVRALQSFYLS